MSSPASLSYSLLTTRSFLEEGKNEDLIRWSEKGDSFIVLDEDEFAKTLIPELFKHRNYASFVRQLNMYGFHKRVGLSDNSMRASERKNKIPSEYSNPYFRRGHPNLLWLISKPKSGTKGKKNSKNDGEGESDEDAGLEDASGQVPSSSSAQATKTLPSTENSAVARKEMNVLREELLQVREQQKIIGGTIRRLQQSNNDLYNQAMLFQNQHDRHQNSINAILNFLANLFRKSLEEQGNAQSVSDIISSMIANQGQAGAHQGNVVDLGDFFQTSVDGGSSLGGPPAKRARGLLPPIPAQNTSARSTRSPSSGRGSFAPPTNHSNQEMGHITELTDGSPADTPPNIRQELETNPQEQMMRIINDHNATNTSGMDLPEAAEFVASAPNLNQDQRNKLANFMARQSNSPSSTGPNFASPSSSRPPAAYNQQAPPQPRPAQQAQPQATPYTGDTAAAPSLSPIMKSPAMDPLSMHQINSNQNELDQLHQLQNQQDQKLSELQSMLGPLSPSGRIPEIDETGGEQYFDPNNVDFDQFFDFNNIDDATFGGVPNDFNVDFSTAGHNNGLNTGQAGMHGGNNNGNTNTPSPAGTEEITRDELGISGGADGGNKRRRVS